MNGSDAKIGIIAGGGNFPKMAANAAKARGIEVVIAAIHGETASDIEKYADKTEWVKLGQLGKIINIFNKAHVTKALMAGTIKKRRLFDGIMPDIRGLSLITKLTLFHDDNILSSIAHEFEKDGIEIISSTSYLPELLACEGIFTKKKPNKEEQGEIKLGIKMVKELGKLDIGQCVVIRKKTVLAVEALEGTDETIRRGGNLAREGAIVVKASKPTQDLRFDIPTVGLDTINTMSEVRASVLAIEAGKTLIFDKEEMIAAADKNGICIVSVNMN